ncbi:hypothetical protein [Methylomonas koyamae]|nr:hypothetical protein [Methylomonas koyamae]
MEKEIFQGGSIGDWRQPMQADAWYKLERTWPTQSLSARHTDE